MLIKINNIDINYEQMGNKNKDTIVLLHGWGQNIKMMEPVAVPFKDNFNIFLLDLPGFGESSEPDFDYQVSDYVQILKEFLKIMKVDNPILIGHSFGGKVSLLYASKYKVKKLILFASPFKKEIVKISLKVKILKLLKKIPLINKLENLAKKHIGSSDYRNSSVLMRKILVNTVNEDITESVKNINCPTIIIWGTNDTQVDISRAYELESLIKDSGLVVYDNCTHYAYLERLNQTISIINSFIND